MTYHWTATCASSCHYKLFSYFVIWVWKKSLKS
jgi:hypothetical protein